jgi:hypothetical protein
MDNDITDLKEVIKGYEAEYKTASSTEDKRLLLQIIKSARETLNIFLEEKKAKSGGKLSRLVIFDLFYSLYSFCIIRFIWNDQI